MPLTPEQTKRRDIVLAALRHVAKRNREFTSDDIVATLAEWRVSGAGPAIAAALVNAPNVACATAKTVRSNRPTRRGHQIRVWESHIYDPATGVNTAATSDTGSCAPS